MGARFFLPHEFRAETGLPERTLNHWHHHGVVPPTVEVDGQPGYDDRHLARVHAALRLKARGVRRLEDIVARLDGMQDAELARFLEEEPLRLALREGLTLEIGHALDEETRALVQQIASLCGVEPPLA